MLLSKDHRDRGPPINDICNSEGGRGQKLVRIIPVGNFRSMGHLDPYMTSIGFTNFFRCLIFDLSFFTKADVVTIKYETSK